MKLRSLCICGREIHVLLDTSTLTPGDDIPSIVARSLPFPMLVRTDVGSQRTSYFTATSCCSIVVASACSLIARLFLRVLPSTLALRERTATLLTLNACQDFLRRLADIPAQASCLEKYCTELRIFFNRMTQPHLARTFSLPQTLLDNAQQLAVLGNDVQVFSRPAINWKQLCRTHSARTFVYA